MAESLKLLVFTSKTCSACAVMKKKKVVELFNADVPGLKVEHHDTDGGKGEALADGFDVQSLPTLIFLNSAGNPVHRINGAPTLNQLKTEHGKALEKAAKIAS